MAFASLRPRHERAPACTRRRVRWTARDAVRLLRRQLIEADPLRVADAARALGVPALASLSDRQVTP